MNKVYQRAMLSGFFATISWLSPVWGQTTGNIIQVPEISVPLSRLSPSGAIFKFPFVYVCYDYFTDLPLNCPFTHDLKGLKEPITLIENNAGHDHSLVPHPLVEPKDTGTLQFLNGTDFDNDPKVVAGHTQNDIAVILHPIPQAAGKLVTETLIHSPPFYRCVSNCFTPTSSKYRYILDVGLKDLRSLVQSANDPFTLPGETTTHPKNHFGTEDAVTRLRKIAQQYKKDSTRKLSINDMSLPKGGMFDLCATYNPSDTCAAAPKGGHNTHRTGTDADIDQQGVPCLQDHDLLKAVLAAGATRKCESEGRKHVDFD